MLTCSNKMLTTYLPWHLPDQTQSPLALLVITPDRCHITLPTSLALFNDLCRLLGFLPPYSRLASQSRHLFLGPPPNLYQYLAPCPPQSSTPPSQRSSSRTVLARAAPRPSPGLRAAPRLPTALRGLSALARARASRSMPRRVLSQSRSPRSCSCVRLVPSPTAATATRPTSSSSSTSPSGRTDASLVSTLSNARGGIGCRHYGSGRASCTVVHSTAQQCKRPSCEHLGKDAEAERVLVRRASPEHGVHGPGMSHPSTGLPSCTDPV